MTNDKVVMTGEELLNHITDLLKIENIEDTKQYKKTMKQMKKLLKPPNIVIEPVEPGSEQKSIKGRPRKEEHEKKPPKDKEYFRNYYAQFLSMEIQCDHCGRYVTKSNISRHRKTPFCMNFKKPENSAIII